jgi:hypothetical protein
VFVIGDVVDRLAERGDLFEPVLTLRAGLARPLVQRRESGSDAGFSGKQMGTPLPRKEAFVYIGIGTIVLILILVLLIAFVF